MAPDQVQLGNLPQSLLRALVCQLAPYQVALIGVQRSNDGDSIAYAGSGVFIARREIKYLLTAAHVWNSVSRFQEIGLCIRESMHDITIGRDDVVPHVVWKQGDVEWGPDIAFLELSKRAVEVVSADRKFLDLDVALSADSRPKPDLTAGVIAVIGAPSSTSQIGTQTAALHAGPWIGGIEKYHDRHGFDCFDIRVDPDSKELPECFGGISGGPAWQVFLHRNPVDETVTWKGSPQLLGVVFSQLDLSAEGRFVRCHGPKSIYVEGPRQAAIA